MRLGTEYRSIPDQPAHKERGRLAVLLLDDNTHFVDYVTAVGIAAGTDIVGPADSRRLPHHVARMHPELQFGAAIVALMHPGHDTGVILPRLAAVGSIDHLVMLVNHPSPSAMAAAEKFARSLAAWRVEAWEKPVHAGFLKSRLGTMAGQHIADTTPDK